MSQLFNVVQETKQFPLRVDFDAAAKREAVQAFVVPEIRKWTFDKQHLMMSTTELRKFAFLSDVFCCELPWTRS